MNSCWLMARALRTTFESDFCVNLLGLGLFERPVDAWTSPFETSNISIEDARHSFQRNFIHNIAKDKSTKI